MIPTPHSQLPGHLLPIWRHATADATVDSLPVVLVVHGPVAPPHRVECLPPDLGCRDQGAPRADCGRLWVCEMSDRAQGVRKAGTVPSTRMEVVEPSRLDFRVK